MNCVTGAGAAQGVQAKKGGEAWMLNQSNKDSAKVTAAKQALTGKLSKPMPKKTAQVFFVNSSVIYTMPSAARATSVLPTGPQGVTVQYVLALALDAVLLLWRNQGHVVQIYKKLANLPAFQAITYMQIQSELRSVTRSAFA